MVAERARPAERADVAAVIPTRLAAPAWNTDTAGVPESARRRFLVAFAAPLAAAAFFVPAAIYLAWQPTTGVLPPSRFDELEMCWTRTDLTALLPDHAFPYPPDRARSALRPPGTTCEFYRSGRDLLDQVDLYRLCWSDDILVAKETIQAKRR
ncbi:hypothetical protein [Streptomyces roseoverticillatus]|uniref:hypothetical protein n=1 Tax=Streptomyces roseoverticillatus TaxID=66429 RepID=UPI001F2D4DD0|nr:hypothetical protein [Streptomyces roseoverticillatus]